MNCRHRVEPIEASQFSVSIISGPEIKSVMERQMMDLLVIDNSTIGFEHKSLENFVSNQVGFFLHRQTASAFHPQARLYAT